MSDIRPIQPRTATYTRWRNPLKVVQHVDIVDTDPQRPMRYSIEPGGSLEIPSIYDRAIHMLDKSGHVIIGGLAPQLRNMHLEKLDKHPALTDSLDTEKQARRAVKLAKARATSNRKDAEDEELLAELDAQEAAAAAAESPAAASAPKGDGGAERPPTGRRGGGSAAAGAGA